MKNANSNCILLAGIACGLFGSGYGEILVSDHITIDELFGNGTHSRYDYLHITPAIPRPIKRTNLCYRMPTKQAPRRKDKNFK